MASPIESIKIIYSTVDSSGFYFGTSGGHLLLSNSLPLNYKIPRHTDQKVHDTFIFPWVGKFVQQCVLISCRCFPNLQEYLELTQVITSRLDFPFPKQSSFSALWGPQAGWLTKCEQAYSLFLDLSFRYCLSVCQFTVNHFHHPCSQYFILAVVHTVQ